MHLLNEFIIYLLSQKKPATYATARNYKADIAKFLHWYENAYSRPFHPHAVTHLTIEAYKKYVLGSPQDNATAHAASSLDRYLSTLRKFFAFLQERAYLDFDPMENPSASKEPSMQDTWRLNHFKNYLYMMNNAPLTIKNYIMDIQQFTDWIQQTMPISNSYQVTDKNAFPSLTPHAIEEYKHRLLTTAARSPLSINRKLSSIRQYMKWLEKEGLVTNQNTKEILNIEKGMPHVSKATTHDQQSRLMSDNDASDYENSLMYFDDTHTPTQETDYSSFAPKRLLQKTKHASILFFDATVNAPLKQITDEITYTFWKLKGKPLFLEEETNSDPKPYTLNPIPSPNVSNFKKEFYAPLMVSTSEFPLYKKLLFHLKHTRPNWYKAYHSYAFVHYMHYGILILVTSAMGYACLQSINGTAQSEGVVLGAAHVPTRNLSFQGTLRDASNLPILIAQNIRFSLYNDQNASGSSLLWQEVQHVKPNPDGSFAVQLGSNAPLSQSLFSGTPLYIGIALENNPELTPREALPTTAYALNAETIDGLFPITNATNQARNVLLALDSSGNLAIGNNASPTFEATDGSLTLSGQTLIMTTQIGSDTNVVLSPDGMGIIDIQKPLQNSTNNSNILGAEGAVEVDDMFAILASSSAQSALTINQNDTGPIISASSSGTAKFTVHGSGDIVATGKLTGITGLSSSGKIKFSDFSQNGGVLYANNVGDLLQTAKGTDSQCLIGGDNPHFGSCSTGVTTSPFWTQRDNTLFANDITRDFLLGGDTPANAKFSLVNMGTATPLARFTGSMTLGGTLGIGTETPHYALSTVGNISLPDSAVGSITNNNILDSADTVTLRLNTGVDPATGTNARFVTFYAGVTTGDTGGTRVGRIGLNGSGGVEYQTGGADFAEEFAVAPETTVEPGDLISIAPSSTSSIMLSQNPYQQTLLGVVSNSAGFTGNTKENLLPNEKRATVGLLGQVKTKVSMENGPIKIGDYITSSSTPGVAMKATRPGHVIGRALESWDCSQNNAELETQNNAERSSAYGSACFSAITVFVQPGFADPTVQLAQNGELAFLMDPSNSNNILQNMTNNMTRYDTFVNKLSLFGDIITKKITTGILVAKEITAQKITTESLVSPIAQIDIVHTNIISPLTTDKVSVNGKLVIKGTNDSSPALEVQGDSSVSGKLTTDSLEANAVDSRLLTVDGNASVSGTLNAKTIVSDTINSIQDNLSSISGQVAGILSNQYQNTSNTTTSITPTPTSLPTHGQATPTPSPAVILGSNATPGSLGDSGQSQNDVASASASASPFDTFDTSGTIDTSLLNFPVTFTEGLLAFGPTSLADTSIAGQLSVGGNLVIVGNGINVLGADLELQPLAQGGIRLMGGKIVIDTQGNLEVNGNTNFAKDVNVQGVLAANIISPLPDQDLVISPCSTSSTSSTCSTSLIVKGASDSAVLSINSRGDLAASGSAAFGGNLIAKNGTFDKLNFSVSQALAVSGQESIATGSAGTAAIKARQTTLTIQNSLITKDSLVYISPVGTQSGQVPFLQRLTPEDTSKDGIEGSFTVGIAASALKDILFNWLIVN